jgi:hypothetical protein
MRRANAGCRCDQTLDLSIIVSNCFLRSVSFQGSVSYAVFSSRQALLLQLLSFIRGKFRFNYAALTCDALNRPLLNRGLGNLPSRFGNARGV